MWVNASDGFGLHTRTHTQQPLCLEEGGSPGSGVQSRRERLRCAGPSLRPLTATATGLRHVGLSGAQQVCAASDRPLSPGNVLWCQSPVSVTQWCVIKRRGDRNRPGLLR